MEKNVVYFEKPGRENTASCLEIVKQSLDENGYKHLLVASTTGETGMLFSAALMSLCLPESEIKRIFWVNRSPGLIS